MNEPRTSRFPIGGALILALMVSACDPSLPDVPPPGTVRPHRPHRQRPFVVVDYLDGRVIDEQGQPIAGAAVWFRGLPNQKTDAQGRFRIRLHEWRRGLRVHNLRVSADGFRPLTTNV